MDESIDKCGTGIEEKEGFIRKIYEKQGDNISSGYFPVFVVKI